MIVEGLSIGDELLDGRVIDSNAAAIDRALSGLGGRTARRTVVRDERAVIAQAVEGIARRAQVCVVTGGLGPTDDDVTAAAIADAAGVALREDPETWRRIQARYAGRAMPPANRRQAALPEGAEIFASDVGTAPAFAVRVGGCLVIALPGVPREVTWHLDAHVIPRLAPLIGEPLARRRLRFALVGESTLAQLVGALALPDTVSVGWRAMGSVTEISLTGASAAVVDAAAAAVRAAAADAWLGEDDITPAEAALRAAEARGLTLGTAESCTGGGVAAALTAVPGASATFLGGIVAYANSVKRGCLGVPAEVLDTHGAVSEPCARAMAQGARRALGVDVAVAITGIAGPGGGTPDKPVGTVDFAWAGPGFEDTARHHIPGDRERVRRTAAVIALDGIRRRLI